jgi:hypothetical protein
MRILGILALASLFLLAAPLSAKELKTLDGKVKKVTPKTIVLEVGGKTETLELGKKVKCYEVETPIKCSRLPSFKRPSRVFYEEAGGKRVVKEVRVVDTEG